MPHPLRTFTRLAVAAAALCLGLASGLAQADNHALVMTIDYAGSGNDLNPNAIESDGRTGARIAESMGVPTNNITRVRNGVLTGEGIVGELRGLLSRIKPGDKVFLYFSGHGTQYPNRNAGNKCSEALVTANLQAFPDELLQQVLERLAEKASQVVMLNDSCFSGGQATKDIANVTTGQKPKFVQMGKAGVANDPDYVCNQPVNVKGALSRTLGVVKAQQPTKVLYIAASADNEVAWVETDGTNSTATKVWGQCLIGGAADTDRNGIVDAEELRRCAQAQIDNNPQRRKQTITVLGESRIPLSFVARSDAPGNTPANVGAALQSIRQAADPTIRVGLQVARTQLTIGRDLLDFSVSVEREGYLHLLHVGTDGKFVVLFPNKLDKNNFVKPGSFRFPRASWGIQAQGPVGRGYIMAYLSDQPKDFAKDFEPEGPFAVGERNITTTEKLGVVALSNRFGASDVVPIDEVK